MTGPEAIEYGPHLEQQQLWTGGSPLPIAAAPVGGLDADLHAVRKHGRADLWQLEEVVLEIGLGL